MNKIDKAVHDLKGFLPDHVHPAQDARSIDVGCYFLMYPYVYFMGHAGGRAICTQSEFEKRASELGYINGYRWGVEYPTGGKSPALNGDVIVEMRHINGSWHEDGEDELDQFHHGSFSAFKITDERYKPADTSYLETRKAEAERKRVVDAAFASLSEFNKAHQVLGELYDVGYLRMPADKE